MCVRMSAVAQPFTCLCEERMGGVLGSLHICWAEVFAKCYWCVHSLVVVLEIDRLHIYQIVLIANCPDCENSRC